MDTLTIHTVTPPATLVEVARTALHDEYAIILFQLPKVTQLYCHKGIAEQLKAKKQKIFPVEYSAALSLYWFSTDLDKESLIKELRRILNPDNITEA